MSSGTEILEGEGEGIEVGSVRGEADAGQADSGVQDDVAYDPKESAQASADRLLGDLKSDDDALPWDKSAETAKDAAADTAKLEGRDETGKFTKRAEKPAKDDDFDPELLPPERFGERAKQAFINSPKGVRREIHRAIKDLESGAAAKVQEATATVREWAPLREAIEPFAKNWAALGVGLVPGILQLAAVQAKLTDPNDGVREQEFAKLAKRARIDVVKLARNILGQSGESTNDLPDLGRHPVLEEVREENRRLSSRLESLTSQLEQRQIDREAAPLLAEMEAVRNEVDQASGRWRYPLLHDEATLSSVKTLVQELVGHNPNLSYPDALREAHGIRMKQIIGESYQASSTRHPAPRETNTQRAPIGGYSVRGRPAPTNGALEPEMPEHVRNDARKSLEWFLRGDAPR